MASYNLTVYIAPNWIKQWNEKGSSMKLCFALGMDTSSGGDTTFDVITAIAGAAASERREQLKKRIAEDAEGLAPPENSPAAGLRLRRTASRLDGERSRPARRQAIAEITVSFRLRGQWGFGGPIGPFAPGIPGCIA
ncbi:hypothetical protein VE00_10522 [Pseudogymnoascus sp. WSF 3629]|nr:hypothetical protein VE00_10522 [Pseudogymnoascus sp. WSF 3629]